MENENNNNTTASGSLGRKRRHTLQFSAETFERIKAHCNTHGLIMRVFAERAILKEIEKGEI